jgi:hypothetical protein
MEDIVTSYEKPGCNMSFSAFPTLTHGFLSGYCCALRGEHGMLSQQAKGLREKAPRLIQVSSVLCPASTQKYN